MTPRAEFDADLASVLTLPSNWRWTPTADLYELLEGLDTSTFAYAEVARELDLREAFAGAHNERSS